MNYSKQIKELLTESPDLSRNEILAIFSKANYIDIALAYFYNDKTKIGLNHLIDGSIQELKIQDCAAHIDAENFIFFFQSFNKRDQKGLIYEYTTIFLQLPEQLQADCVDQISYDHAELIEFYEFLYSKNKPPFYIANELLANLKDKKIHDADLTLVHSLIQFYPQLMENNLDFFSKLARFDLAIATEFLLKNYKRLDSESRNELLNLLIAENPAQTMVSLLECEIRLSDEQLFQIFRNNYSYHKIRISLLDALTTVSPVILKFYLDNLSILTSTESNLLLSKSKNLTFEQKNLLFSLAIKNSKNIPAIFKTGSTIDFTQVELLKIADSILEDGSGDLVIFFNQSQIFKNTEFMNRIIFSKKLNPFRASEIASHCEHLNLEQLIELASIAASDDSSSVNFISGYNQNRFNQVIIEKLAESFNETSSASLVGSFLTKTSTRLSKGTQSRLIQLALKDSWGCISLIKQGLIGESEKQELVQKIASAPQAILAYVSQVQHLTSSDLSLFIDSLTKGSNVLSLIELTHTQFQENHWKQVLALPLSPITIFSLIKEYKTVLPEELLQEKLTSLVLNKSISLLSYLALEPNEASVKNVLSNYDKKELIQNRDLFSEFIQKNENQIVFSSTPQDYLAGIAIKGRITEAESKTIQSEVKRDKAKIKELFDLDLTRFFSFEIQKQWAIDYCRNSPDLSLSFFDRAQELGASKEIIDNILPSPEACLILLKRNQIKDPETIKELVDSALVIYEISDLLNSELNPEQELIALKFFLEQNGEIASRIGTKILQSRNDAQLINFAIEYSSIKEENIPELLRSKGEKIRAPECVRLLSSIKTPKIAAQVLHNSDTFYKTTTELYGKLYDLASQEPEMIKTVNFTLSRSSSFSGLAVGIKNQVLFECLKVRDADFMPMLKKIPWDEMNDVLKSLVYQKLAEDSNLAWLVFEHFALSMTAEEKMRTLSHCADITNRPGFNFVNVYSHVPQMVNEIVAQSLQSQSYSIEDSNFMISGSFVAAIYEGNLQFLYPLNELMKKQIAHLLSQVDSIPESVTGKYLLDENVFLNHSGERIDLNPLKVQMIDSETKKNTQKLKAILYYKPVKEISGCLKNTQRGMLSLELDVLTVQAAQPKRESSSSKVLSLNLSNAQGLLQKFDELLKINPNRAFGIEIEIASKLSRAKIGRELQKQGIGIKVIDLYGMDSTLEPKKLKFDNWEIKDDQSIEGDKFGFNHAVEIISPKLYGDDGIRELKKVLESLLGLGSDNFFYSEEARVGLHVHHDLSDVLALENEFKGLREQINRELFKIQEPLYLLCASHRRKNTEFCDRLHLTNVRGDGFGLESKWTESKVRGGFNFMSTREDSKPTMEFRMKETTLNIDEIVHWVMLTQNVVTNVSETILGDIQMAKVNLNQTLQAMTVEKILQVSRSNEKINKNDRVWEEFYEALNFSKVLIDEG